MARSCSKDRRAFLKSGLTVAVGLGSVLTGCGGSDSSDPSAASGTDGGDETDASPEVGSDAGTDGSPGLDAQPDVAEDVVVDAPDAADAATSCPRPITTVRERIRGVLSTEKQSSSNKHLWGVTETVDGDPHVRVDGLDVDSIAEVPTEAAVSILFMAQISDVHITDEESPARTINLAQVTAPSWRKHEAHNTQVLDAMVRKLHQFNECRALDCVVFTGDCIDNNQKNELDWFLRTLEGGPVTPNSGELEDPIPGPDNDPHDTFEARGLGTIPWYMVSGNHDLLIQGNLSHGTFIDYSGVTGDPTRGHIGTIAMGRVNPPTCNEIPSDESSDPDRCIPTDPGDLKSGDLPPDPDRKHLSSKDWYRMVLDADGLPAGHGFKNYAYLTGIGDYVVEPTPGVPLRLVVLDTSSPVGAQGNYDRIDSFLEPALQQALDADMAVIVVSHHYSSGIFLQGQKLRETLAKYPNVLAHLAGHGHTNSVTAVKGQSPEYGYWEVQTCGLVDWPQQARLVEVVDNRNGTVELWLTMIDYEVDHQPMGPIAQASRFFALYEAHQGKLNSAAVKEGGTHDRNVILPVAIPPGVRDKLAQVQGKEPESPLFASPS